MKKQPEATAPLHLKASEWYERHNLTADAVRHAFAAEDYERAAALIELAWPEMDNNRQSAVYARWVRKLPEGMLHNRPVLNHGFAWALLATGELEAADAQLQTAEKSLNAPPEAQVIVDRERYKTLAVSIASARAYYAQAVGDTAGTVRYAQQAFDLIPEENLLERGRPAGILAMALWSNGELEAAAQTLSEAMTNARRAGNAVFAITGTYVLTVILKGLGRLREAINLCHQSLALADDQADPHEPQPRGTADIHVALCDLLLEQGEDETAEHHLQQSAELGPQAQSIFWSNRYHLAQARLKAFHGAYDQALDLLDEAERRYVRGPAPETQPAAALKTAVWLAQGNLPQAKRWVRYRGLTADDALDYLREYEHMTLAGVLIADYKEDRQTVTFNQMMGLLERLLETAEANGRTGTTIDLLNLQALALAAKGERGAALEALDQALVSAEAEDYVRPFVIHGGSMAKLLSAAAERGIRPSYTAKLLAALTPEKQPPTGRAQSPPPTTLPSHLLVEPLSERELEVLQLVAQGLSNREIAERLYIALPTVKGHNQKIYQKLQVNRRTEAVAQAQALGLL
jgi:LuxR family maltose regulon positive regulatory protein